MVYHYVKGIVQRILIGVKIKLKQSLPLNWSMQIFNFEF